MRKKKVLDNEYIFRNTHNVWNQENNLASVRIKNESDIDLCMYIIYWYNEGLIDDIIICENDQETTMDDCFKVDGRLYKAIVKSNLIVENREKSLIKIFIN